MKLLFLLLVLTLASTDGQGQTCESYKYTGKRFGNMASIKYWEANSEKKNGRMVKSDSLFLEADSLMILTYSEAIKYLNCALKAGPRKDSLFRRLKANLVKIENRREDRKIQMVNYYGL